MTRHRVESHSGMRCKSSRDEITQVNGALANSGPTASWAKYQVIFRAISQVCWIIVKYLHEEGLFAFSFCFTLSVKNFNWTMFRRLIFLLSKSSSVCSLYILHVKSGILQVGNVVNIRFRKSKTFQSHSRWNHLNCYESYFIPIMKVHSSQFIHRLTNKVTHKFNFDLNVLLSTCWL